MEGQVSSSDTLSTLQNTEDNFVGGKVLHYLDNWINLTSDKFLLGIVHGYVLEFTVPPVQVKTPRPLVLPHFEKLAMDKAVVELIRLGVVEVCEPNCGAGVFYSNIFPAMKPDGSARIILNLQDLNLHVEHYHFKMDTVTDVLRLITPQCYMASVDLKHAYFSVPVRTSDRDWFRFMWNDLHLRFMVLPQGFSASPRIFTKLLKPIFAHFRSLGMSTAIYIDDCIFLAESEGILAKNIDYAIGFLDNLGFTINVGKSNLIPSQRIEFLGYDLNSKDMSATLPERKCEWICELGYRILTPALVRIRDLASFIGTVVATEHAVPLAALRYKYLEIVRNDGLRAHKGDYNQYIMLNDRARMDIRWWISHIHCQSKSFLVPAVEFEITTDASTIGWGARLGDAETKGHWASSELDHINLLELKAVLYGLQSLVRDIRDTHVLVRSDNATTVACINRHCSIKESLLDVTIDIFDWCSERGIYLSASHIRGVSNVEADRLSRDVKVNTEWMLKPKLFQGLLHIFGVPIIDLFASRINYQLPAYVSWRPDPKACDIDAFAMSWSCGFMYAFPPFSIVGRVLQKIIQDQAEVLVVLPLWPTRVWFAQAMSLLVGYPRLLPRNALVLPQAPELRHPLGSKLVMTGMLLSGVPSKIKEFRRGLPTFSCHLGGPVLDDNIGVISPNGCRFVSGDKLIRFIPL